MWISIHMTALVVFINEFLSCKKQDIFQELRGSEGDVKKTLNRPAN